MSRIDERLAQDRRRFLRTALTGGALLAVGGGLALPRLLAAGRQGTTSTMGGVAGVAATGGDLMLECFADQDGRDLGPCHANKLVLSDQEWHARLSDEAYDVLRQAGTERAFSGQHEKPAARGLYRCVGCDTALFDDATQFDSGTGWPSFWQPIAKQNVREIRDTSFGWERIAISCACCDGHLGHVFDDGPPPTGLRYCMNSVALRFVARAGG